MPWAVPAFSRGRVNAAGQALIAAGAFDDVSAQVIGNWRAAHAYPLFHLQMNLRSWATKVSADSLVSQRLKRLSSIALKLRLNAAMKLSQMQDIGGCRAILENVAEVERVVASLRASRALHELIREDDYIVDPKESGYRGHHLIFKYRNRRITEYDGLRIEMQVRTRAQHAWATAVETAGTFQGQALKSNLGSEDWRYFFKLVASDIARREGCAAVSGVPATATKLRAEIRRYDKMLRAVNHLRAWQASLHQAESSVPGAYYFLLQLFPDENRLTIEGYRKENLDAANAAYLEMEEQAIASGQVSDSVLVSVESIRSLRRAYPNYFSDTDRFIEAVELAKK
jgi:hypothetical protein